MNVTCVWVPDITQSKSCVLVEVRVPFYEYSGALRTGQALCCTDTGYM